MKRIAIIILLIATPASARWKSEYANAPFSAWYEAQQNCNARNCCGSGDGEAYYGGIKYNSDGSVTLENGTHIEKCDVLPGVNPTGHAIWWHNGDQSYCFAPGSGS